jgi:hypothetical protein
MKPRISAIIPTLNQELNIANVLRSVASPWSTGLPKLQRRPVTQIECPQQVEDFRTLR